MKKNGQNMHEDHIKLGFMSKKFVRNHFYLDFLGQVVHINLGEAHFSVF